MQPMPPPPPGGYPPPPPGQGYPPPGYPPPGYPPPGYPPPGYPPAKKSLLWLWILLGVGGAIVVLGILAAVAIPSFMSYQKKAKRSEADLNLRAIGRGATRTFAERSAFPSGRDGPTPALGTCCAGPNHKCPVVLSDWLGSGATPSVWDELSFEPTAPFYFSYSYEGAPDGMSFTATAQGDLDCDGTYVTYKILGKVVGGYPEIEVLPPDGRD